eukprot:scaffold2224_cov261-Pinguiococcus_pyrenoidosus.AAC.34
MPPKTMRNTPMYQIFGVGTLLSAEGAEPTRASSCFLMMKPNFMKFVPTLRTMEPMRFRVTPTAQDALLIATANEDYSGPQNLGFLNSTRARGSASGRRAESQ